MGMNKKNGLFITILVIIFLIGAFIYQRYEAHKVHTTSLNQEEKVEVIFKEDSDETYESIKKYIETDKAYLILGRSGCHYCSAFLPVLNELKDEYSLDYKYVDIRKLSENDYQSLMNSNIVIPAKCSGTGSEQKINEGFGTPLSLFFENGRVYDCIRGYKDKTTLISLLKNNNYIN